MQSNAGQHSAAYSCLLLFYLQGVHQKCAMGLLCYQLLHHAEFSPEVPPMSSLFCWFGHPPSPSCCIKHRVKGHYQLADSCLQLGVGVMTDPLMTTVAGCSCNAATSRVPSASITYGSASWLMKTSSIRLVPAWQMLQVTAQKTPQKQTNP